MRKITIDFTKENPCENTVLGFIGEHNATELIIIPPSELAENERVTGYAAAFTANGSVIRSRTFRKDEELIVSLWKQLTEHSILGVQLEAFDYDGELVAKSVYVPFLRFLPSADGVSADTKAESDSVLSEIAANTSARHGHEKRISTLENDQAQAGLFLERFSIDENGNLYFDGVKMAKERRTAVWETDAAFENGLFLNAEEGDCSGIYNILSGKIPVNSEIKSIEIKWDDNDFIDIREINAQDTDGMYAVTFYRAITAANDSQYLFTILTDDTSGVPDVVWRLTCEDPSVAIRVTYYLD